MNYCRNVCASIQTRGDNLKTAKKYCRTAVVRQEKVIYRKNKMGKKHLGLRGKRQVKSAKGYNRTRQPEFNSTTDGTFAGWLHYGIGVIIKR